MRPLFANREEGASLVEFALIMPFLVLLLMGVVEFAWLFGQHLDVRQAAREGARLASINHPTGPSTSTNRTSTNTDSLVGAICDRMNDSTGAEITITAETSGAQKEEVSVTAAAPGDTLTNFLNWAIPANLELSSTIEGRIVYQANWADTTDQACP